MHARPEGKANGAGKAKVRRFDKGFVLEDLAMGQPDGKLAKAGNKVRRPRTCSTLCGHQQLEGWAQAAPRAVW